MNKIHAISHYPNLNRLFADLHAHAIAIANRERTVKTWPFITPEYADHCAEHCLEMDCPDSVLHFAEMWQPIGTDIGICGKCMHSCRAKFKDDSSPVPGGSPMQWREYLGSDCCKATIYDAAGNELEIT